MGRIHPGERKSTGSAESANASGGDRLPSTWTVWKKSSMGFQGTDGFSVYDSDGRLAFRVDNYSRRRKCFAGELLLMDGDGRAIMSLRPQLMSMHDQWNGYRAEDGFAEKQKMASPLQLFAMRRCAILQSGDAAEVFMGWPDGRQKVLLPPKPSFRVEGCFWRRSCKILGRDGEEAARICRKKAAAATGGGSATAAAAVALLGDDVFSLVVQPGVDCRLIMAFVVVMDRICKKKPSGAPVMCS
ncbi:protein LURP-one-related 8-like [Ananas comosus]|uniref:Protein LURP-one-related 8-like n=1 Tax=Ananas comosus TaxID=4615 RepID=A0A6P5H2L5_ANACO|nr:protein LURP-one-related 8-like [Ananas comosus]